MSNANDFIIENGVLKKYVGPGGDVTIAQAVLNTHMRIDQVSKSCMLFLSMMMRMNSMVMTSARMIPAMGRITLLERF